MAQDDSSDVEGCDPQYSGLTFSAICSLLPRDYLLMGVLRDILTRHFSNANWIEHPALRHLIWREAEDAAILIETVYRWRPQDTESRPGVLIRCNDFQNQRIGAFGEAYQGQPADSEGNQHFCTYWVGSFTVLAIAESGAQAMYLGTECQRELTEFGPEVERSLNLFKWHVMSRGAPFKVREAKNNWAVPVTIGMAYEERWILRNQAPRLRGLSLSKISGC